MRPKYIVFAITACTALALATPRPASAEQDHLTCFKAKDEFKVKVETIVSITKLTGQPQFVLNNCRLKSKARKICFQTEKNGGDDPRGALLVDDYVCYKVKCDDKGTQSAFLPETQFAAHDIRFKRKVFEICAPTD